MLPYINMNTFKSRGLVIKESNTGESNKILTVLFKEHGKMTVFSRGARNTKSKFLAGSQLFSYSDFVIYNRNNFKTTSQIDLIESYFSIRSDYNKLCYCSYFLEMTDHFILENMSADDILYLLIRTFSTMSHNLLDDKIIYITFSYKFLQLNGYSPLLSSCANCNNPLEKEVYFYHEGALCPNCKSIASMKISDASIYTINHILNSNLQNLYSFSVTDKVYKELERAYKVIFDYHFNIKLKSLEFLL